MQQSDTSTDCSDAWSPSSNQKSMSHYHWWLYKTNLVQFEDARWYLDTPACGAPSDHNGTNFAQTFSMPKSSVVIFQTLYFLLFQLTCDHSKRQSTLTALPWPTLTALLWPNLNALLWPTLTALLWPTLNALIWPTLTALLWPTLNALLWTTLTSLFWPTLTELLWPTLTAVLDLP